MYNNRKENIVYVYDFFDSAKTDSEIIDNCFKFIDGFKNYTVIFDRKNWYIDKAILLPSNTTIIVDGVTIKQNDLMFDNIFRGNNFEIDPKNPNGFPIRIKPLCNVQIIGKNQAVLEGPDKLPKMFHPTMNEEQEMAGDYWGWRNFQICLSMCTDFEIAGFKFIKTRSWAVSFDRCSGGYIHDMEFRTTVKNGDGINIRMGCNNISIENIKGDTSDDLIAINSMSLGETYPVLRYVYPCVPAEFQPNEDGTLINKDIYNIRINNVWSSTSLYSSAVAFLSRNGNKIYNISLNNIIDQNPVSRSERLSVVFSYKGYSQGYKSGDLHSLRINNIVSNSAKCAVVFNDIVTDVWINKVAQNRPDGTVLNAVDINGIKITNSSN